jgi:hypothetical protein
MYLRTTTLKPLDADHIQVGVTSFIIHPGYNETTFVDIFIFLDILIGPFFLNFIFYTRKTTLQLSNSPKLLMFAQCDSNLLV